MFKRFTQVVILSAVFLSFVNAYTADEIAAQVGADVKPDPKLNRLASNCLRRTNCKIDAISGLVLKNGAWQSFSSSINEGEVPFAGELGGLDFKNIGYAENRGNAYLIAATVVPPFNFKASDMLTAYNSACGTTAVLYNGFARNVQDLLNSGNAGTINCPSSGGRSGACSFGIGCVYADSHDDAATQFKDLFVDDKTGENYSGKVTHINFVKASQSQKVCAVYAIVAAPAEITVNFQDAFRQLNIRGATYSDEAARIADILAKGGKPTQSDVTKICAPLKRSCSTYGGCAGPVITTSDAVEKLRQYVRSNSKYVGFARKDDYCCVYTAS